MLCKFCYQPSTWTFLRKICLYGFVITNGESQEAPQCPKLPNWGITEFPRHGQNLPPPWLTGLNHVWITEPKTILVWNSHFIFFRTNAFYYQYATFVCCYRIHIMRGFHCQFLSKAKNKIWCSGAIKEKHTHDWKTKKLLKKQQLNNRLNTIMPRIFWAGDNFSFRLYESRCVVKCPEWTNAYTTSYKTWA